MATNPIHDDPDQEWPKRGEKMSEEDFHELERRDPVYRYEYINGMVYRRSGETVAHSRIMCNITSALDRHLTGFYTTFGGGVQVLIDRKESGERHYVYPDAAVTCSPEDSYPYNVLVKSPKIVFEVLSPGTEKKIVASSSAPTRAAALFRRSSLSISTRCASKFSNAMSKMIRTGILTCMIGERQYILPALALTSRWRNSIRDCLHCWKRMRKTRSRAVFSLVNSCCVGRGNY